MCEMCLDDSVSYRPASTVTDELDNQVITDHRSISDIASDKLKIQEDSCEAEEKRKQIGDEFYREADIDLDTEPAVVELTGSIIATVTTDQASTIATTEDPIISVPVFSVKSEETSQLTQTQAQVSSDQESDHNSCSPARSSPTTDTVYTASIAIQSEHAPIHHIFQEDLSTSGQSGQPQGKLSKESSHRMTCLA